MTAQIISLAGRQRKARHIIGTTNATIYALGFDHATRIRLRENTRNALLAEARAEAAIGPVSADIMEQLEIYNGGYSHEW